MRVCVIFFFSIIFILSLLSLNYIDKNTNYLYIQLIQSYECARRTWKRVEKEKKNILKKQTSKKYDGRWQKKNKDYYILIDKIWLLSNGIFIIFVHSLNPSYHSTYFFILFFFKERTTTYKKRIEWHQIKFISKSRLCSKLLLYLVVHVAEMIAIFLYVSLFLESVFYYELHWSHPFELQTREQRTWTIACDEWHFLCVHS